MVLLPSCQTYKVQGVEVIPFNNIQGYPLWWQNQAESTPKTLYFYESAMGENPYLVRLDAIDKLLNTLVESLHDENGIDERYRSELITTYRIDDLALKITNISVYLHPYNTYECILKAECDANIFYSEGKVSLDEIIQIESEINKIRLDAKSAYRDNNDYEALLLYIKAAGMAEAYPIISGSNSFEELTERAKRIIKNIYFTIFGVEATGGSCYVLARRKVGIIHPRVKGAEILCTHIVEREDASREVYSTDDRGIISYKSSMMADDNIESAKFKLSLPYQLDLFKTEKGKAFVKELKALTDKNEIDFSYVRENTLNDKTSSVVILLQDENGEVIKDSSLQVEFTSLISAVSETEFKMITLDDRDEGILFEGVNEESFLKDLERYKESDKDNEYMLIFFVKVDEVQNIQRTSERAVSTKGKLYFYDKTNEEILYKNEDISGVGVNINEYDAIKDSFRMCFEFASKSFQNFVLVDFE